MSDAPQSRCGRIVVTQRIHQEIAVLLSGHGSVAANDSTVPWPREELLEHARKARALMVFMPDFLDEAFLRACPELVVVAGALKGADNFDIQACTRFGIGFTVVPDLLSEPTADLALTLLLGLVRNVAEGDRLIRTGRYQGWRPILYGTGLRRGTVGLIGFGAVGRALAQMLQGFRCRLLVCDPAVQPETAAQYNGRCVDLDELLASSDFVLPLLPLTGDTFHLIDAAALARMKQGSYLVNVSRGSVVDEEAIAAALETGRLSGYAADTFEMEDWARSGRPEEISPRLLGLTSRTLFTPHLGSAVASARLEIERAAANNIIQALRGERPAGAINSPAHPRNRQ